MDTSCWLAFKVGATLVVLAGAETLHGIVRTVLLAPRLGQQRAKQVSIITGTLLAAAVCWLMVPWLDVVDPLRLIEIGAVLALGMALFDIILGVYVARMPWRRVLAEFDPRTGNLLSLGLVILVFLPRLVMSIQA
jgi:hypothetical protein